MLTLVLAAVPQSAARRQGADGLPTDFDGWVFSQITGILPRVSPADSRRLWQPILDLGPPGHHWVERFFRDWFTDGYQQAPTPEAFTAIWEDMIRFAAGHARWSADQDSYDLAGMVKELLDCSRGIYTVAKDQAYTVAIGRLTPAFDEARGKWFGMARVGVGFARFAVAPAAAHLLLPEVLWLSKASETVTATKSERDLDDALITFLHEAWERHRVELARDGVLMEAFQEILTRLAARSSHAALALRDRVVNALSN
ncbi:MAG: hypothetical protein JWM11_4761 [Planctomycetaceae bacterium]|nr:hypothetical protein [Planctomycetaceae bacterium]